MKKFINYIKEFFLNFEVFLKYQIVSRILFSVILMPIFWVLVNILLKSKGINVISNNDIFRFLFSIQGLIFIILLLLIVFFGFIVEIYGFITVSSLAINKQNEVNTYDIYKRNTTVSEKLALTLSSLIPVNLIVCSLPFKLS